MSRSVTDFLERFALPLVAGGEARVGKPISGSELELMAHDLGHASVPIVAIDEARHEVLSELVIRPPALVFDADELSLIASIHNLLFLSHPRSDGWMATERARRRVLEAAYVFASRPLSRSRTRNLARHGLLHNVFDLKRRDIKLKWWTGSAEFVGQSPPPRLLRWRGMRRVQEEVEFATFSDLLGDPELAPVLVTLLRRSPITQLWTIDHDGPRLHWEDAAFLLRDAELARAIAYRAIEGTTAGVVARCARMAAAFDQMLERGPSEADVRVVAAFLVYLNTLLVVRELDATPRAQRNQAASRPSPLLANVLAPDRAGSRPRGLSTFFALPSSAARIDPSFEEVPGLRADPALKECWDKHRRQAVAGVGDGVIASLSDRLRRHMKPLLAAAPARS